MPLAVSLPVSGNGRPQGIFYRRTYMKTAILVDGGFYRRRAQSIWGDISAKDRADELERYCFNHLKDKHEQRELYRIFYYDCPPIKKKIYHPHTKKQIDMSKTPLYEWSTLFFSELKKKRKFALRMGRLAEEQAHYTLRPEIIKKLANGSLTLNDLSENSYMLSLDQKGVDMKIGIDISSMAYKKQVEQIILISGDSDFVPVLKLARREGIDVILDPMRTKIKEDLMEHIDGIRTKIPDSILKRDI